MPAKQHILRHELIRRIGVSYAETGKRGVAMPVIRYGAH
jgi:hypothetical protein